MPKAKRAFRRCFDGPNLLPGLLSPGATRDNLQLLRKNMEGRPSLGFVAKDLKKIEGTFSWEDQKIGDKPQIHRKTALLQRRSGFVFWISRLQQNSKALGWKWSLTGYNRKFCHLTQRAMNLEAPQWIQFFVFFFLHQPKLFTQFLASAWEIIEQMVSKPSPMQETLIWRLRSLPSTSRILLVDL